MIVDMNLFMMMVIMIGTDILLLCRQRAGKFQKPRTLPPISGIRRLSRGQRGTAAVRSVCGTSRSARLSLSALHWAWRSFGEREIKRSCKSLKTALRLSGRGQKPRAPFCFPCDKSNHGISLSMGLPKKRKYVRKSQVAFVWGFVILYNR